MRANTLEFCNINDTTLNVPVCPKTQFTALFPLRSQSKLARHMPNQNPCFYCPHDIAQDHTWNVWRDDMMPVQRLGFILNDLKYNSFVGWVQHWTCRADISTILCLLFCVQASWSSLRSCLRLWRAGPEYSSATQNSQSSACMIIKSNMMELQVCRHAVCVSL